MQILNQSGKVINKLAETLLKKGLTYVPDKKDENISQIMSDIDDWGRRLKLKIHFHKGTKSEKKRNEDDTPKWRKKPPSTTWVPNIETVVDDYIDNVKMDLIS